MFAALLLMAGIYTTTGFNIYTSPVHKFEHEDKLFGQTIIKSRDGVFTPSTSGEVFKCILYSSCSPFHKGDKTMKGLRPIASIASILSEKEEEQLLACNQVRTKNKSSEDFNGHCAYVVNQEEMDKINPAELASQQMKQNSMAIDKQAHSRRRRQADLNTEAEEDEDEEDPGTEIAFVLDGSGSIEAEDFERAKEFIQNVMKNVWTTCFTCNFAVVQFGSEVKTELSLLDNTDGAEALKKVKNIKQLYNLTKTASALYHVLTEVFVPENGSNPKSTKIIIVLSDGEMRGKQKNLTEVLNMKEMNGIIRVSIGVGPEVLDNPKAINEMIEIAGSKEKFFKVSNYAALETILSFLEKSIFAIEGIEKGVGFKFELAEAGFSSHLTNDGSMLFGAVGAYDWSGGIILKRKQEETVTFLKATDEEPRFSYLGYSVASAHTSSSTLYISGAPRYNLTGAVFVFDGSGQDVIKGNQVGSYFGSVLCTLDIDNDQQTDYLLVGAPHYHEKGEEGQVIVYKLHQGKFERESLVLRGRAEDIYARFGSAIANIGDIDGNKYSDIAVGAPLEATDHLSASSGSIYIYNGFSDGIRPEFSQRITPSDFGMKLVHFGQAVSAIPGPEKDKNKLFISCGSEGMITILQTIPVIIITANIKIGHEEISLAKQTNDKSNKFETTLQICFDETRKKISSGEQLKIEYQIDLDYGKEEKRLFYVKKHEKKNIFTLSKDKNCDELVNVEYVGCEDCISPIKIRAEFNLSFNSSEIPVRALDRFSPREFMKEIPFEKDCADKQKCEANISLADSNLSNNLIIIGMSQSLSINFDLQNLGDSSYMTTLTLSYPEILQSKLIEGGQCEVKNGDLQITCKLLHPVFKSAAKTTVTITWQPKNSKTDLRNAIIYADLKGGNNGTEDLDSKAYEFRVKHSLDLQLVSGSIATSLLTIEDGEKGLKNIQFSFKLQGENKYNAKVTVTVTIPKKKNKIEVSIKNIQPKICVHVDKNTESNYRIECNLTKAQDLDVYATVLIDDLEDKPEKITATAELSFDENIYGGTDIKRYQTSEVTLNKVKVVKSTALITGGSIGGFLVLIFIIVILVKCGFFRRRHRMERQQSTN